MKSDGEIRICNANCWFASVAEAFNVPQTNSLRYKTQNLFS